MAAVGALRDHRLGDASLAVKGAALQVAAREEGKRRSTAIALPDRFFEGNSRSVAGYEPPSLALLLPALPLLPPDPSAHHPERGGHPPAVARDGPARVELPEAGGVRGVGLGAPDGLALTVHQGAPTVEAVALEGEFF